MKKSIFIVLALCSLTAFSGCGDKKDSSSSEKAKVNKPKEVKTADYIDPANTNGKTTLTLIGHASVKLTTKDGKVIYIDPYYNGDYSAKADLLLVTHEHSDHNNVGLVTLNANGKTLRSKDMLINGTYQTKEINGIKIEAVPAENSHHYRAECVGYIITVDGITIYHAGDTSKVPEMSQLADRHLDYVLLPCDGLYNMKPEEATECADIISAKHAIPIHVSVADANAEYDLENAKKFTAKNGMLVEYGKTIELVK